MKHDIKQELRYYVPLLMGFTLILIGIFSPPVGEISTSVIYASGMFICLCAAIVGLDIPSILHEVRLIKENSLKTMQQQFSKDKNQLLEQE